jgi:hypothetical protein
MSNRNIEKIFQTLNYLQREASKVNKGADTFEIMCQLKKDMNEGIYQPYDGSIESKIMFLNWQIKILEDLIAYIITIDYQNIDIMERIWLLKWDIEKLFIDIQIKNANKAIQSELDKGTIKIKK